MAKNLKKKEENAEGMKNVKPMDTVEVNYIKPNDLRTCVSSGIIGGITPNGGIHLNFFIDKPSIPDSVRVELREGMEYREVERKGGNSIDREVQASILLDLTTAKKVSDWLSTQVSMLEKIYNSGENK